MDEQRVGRIVRALRRRLGWRQADLAAKAGCSQGEISLIERGHLRGLSMLRRVLAALDASLVLDVRWRAGALDRLLDEDHAWVVGAIASLLERFGWTTLAEVTYSEFGERGSFDLLAWHPQSRIVLVVEAKTDLPSVEATLRKLDEKQRLAPGVALRRCGWHAVQTARLLVMPDQRTLRRRVDRHHALLAGALPMRGVAVRQWLAKPSSPMSGLWFVPLTNSRSGIQANRGRERIRRPRKEAAGHESLPTSARHAARP